MTSNSMPVLVKGASAKLVDPATHLEPLGVPFNRLSGVLRRRIWVIMLTLLIGNVAALVLLVQSPKKYTGVASVLIEPQRTQVSDLQATSLAPENLPNVMHTQIDILRSPAMSRRVVAALGLAQNPEFTAQPGTISKLITRIEDLTGLRKRTDLSGESTDATEVAAEKLATKVYFSNEARSNVLRIYADTGSPKLSASIANEYAEQFLEFKRHLKFDAVQLAHEWFQDRLKELSVKVRKADQAVQDYRNLHGLIDSSLGRDGGGGQSSANQQQLVELSRQLALATAERSRREAQLAQATTISKAQGRPDALPEVLQSSLDQKLRELEATVAAREAQVAATQGDHSPELQALQAQRRGLQRRIQDSMSNIVMSLQTSVTQATGQERSLLAAVGRARDALMHESEAEVGLHGLQAEAQASRSIYETFLNRATQLANVAGIQEADASLVSRALPPPDASAPKPIQYIGVACFLSLSIGLGIALLLDRMRTGYATADDLEADLGVKTLGFIPTVTLSPHTAAPVGKRALDFFGAVAKVRGLLQVMDLAHRPKVIMVTSALPREGKTVFSISLAVSAARAGWRTLLIDCDMRKPSIADRMGLDDAEGLQHLLAAGDIGNFAQFVHRAGSGLDVLPTRLAGSNPQDLLASQRMTALLNAARGHYDFVVLDTTPILPVADALVLSQQVDATIMAVRWESTSRAIVRKAMRMLLGSSATVLGTLLTQVNLRAYAQTDVTAVTTLQSEYSDYFMLQR